MQRHTGEGRERKREREREREREGRKEHNKMNVRDNDIHEVLITARTMTHSVPLNLQA